MLWIIAIGLVLLVLAMLAVRRYKRRQVSSSTTETVPLSEVSKHMLKLYNRLPTEHQFGDLTDVLHALDVRHKIEGARTVGHFHYGGYREYAFTWKCCESPVCAFKDYQILRTRIQEVIDRVEEQAHLLSVSKVQSDLDRFDHILAGMASEARILESVNKQIRDM